MARAIGQVKSYENGTFFKKDVNGRVSELKSGDTIYEGEQVYGAQTNLANAKIVIDILLAGAGDLVISKDGGLTLDASVLEGVFSHHDAVVNLNSMQEALAMAAAAKGEGNIPSPEGSAAGTEAGDETAAGTVLTDTERVADVFDSRTGAITDVTTDLRVTTPSTAAASVQPTEVTLLETETPSAPTPPPPPPGVEANAPILDVRLGELQIETHENPLENPSISFSAIGAGIAYTDSSGNLMVDSDGNVVSTGATVHFNPGNGYGVTTSDESSAGVQRIDTTGDAREALVLDLDDNLVSLNVGVRHFKQDDEGARWEAYDSTGKLVGTGTVYTTDFDPNSDASHTITITPNLVDDGSFQYVVFIGSVDGYYVTDVGTGTSVDYTYSYPLILADASLSDGSETLGDYVFVSGLPAGATLSHDTYGDITVPDDGDGTGTVTFGSDTDYTTWTLHVDEPLASDTSIVASLSSTESDGSTATAYVGVYGDNVIVGSDGNDSFDGRDGSDSLSGGEGNDSFIFDSADTLVDGGAGTDTLILVGNTAIDFDAWDSSALKNIEVIDLTGGDHQLSNLSLSDVVNMTDVNNNIYILGDAGDSVDFQNSDGWEISVVTPTVTQTVNGVEHTFDVYVNADDPTVMVHVEQIITDTI